MAGKKRTVRFFVPKRVQPDGTSIQLQPNFWKGFRKKVEALPAAEQFVNIRDIDYRGAARHEQSNSADYLYLGKTRDKADLPERSVGEGDETPLILREGERLVEPCYIYVVKPQSNRIATLRSSGGPSVSAVGEWITGFYQNELGIDRIVLEPVMREDQMDRLNEALNVASFSVTIEKHQNLGDVPAESAVTQAVKNSYETLDRGARVDYSWSFGHKSPESSLGETLKNDIKTILGWGLAKYAKATVIRESDDGHLIRDKIDFIKDQVTTQVTVGTDPAAVQSADVVLSALLEAARRYDDLGLDEPEDPAKKI